MGGGEEGGGGGGGSHSLTPTPPSLISHTVSVDVKRHERKLERRKESSSNLGRSVLRGFNLSQNG